jgi:membrane-bound lytic murein transglycosylase A
VKPVEKQDFSELLKATQKSLVYFQRIKDEETFSYGELSYSKAEMIASTLLLKEIIEKGDSSQIIKDLRKKFLWLKSPGREKDGRTLFTGYFEPLFFGSETSDDTYNIPLYAVPKNLQVLDLGEFRKNLEDRTIVYRTNEENEIVPYYSREQIMDGVLEQTEVPIAWLQDTTDLFFLQVQGSGLLQTPDGKLLRVGYAGANGRAYTSVGRVLIQDNLVPASQMSMQAIRNYLTENPIEKISLLNLNESYVFFRLLDIAEGPYGSLNVALTPRNSLAVDYQLYPDGALAYIDTSAPDCELDCNQHKPLQRFVMIQDTGGAIRGYGRADFFWGRGELMARSAGFMQHLGDLYVLVAKKEYLQPEKLN